MNMHERANRQHPQEATSGGPPWASRTAKAGWVLLLVISMIAGLNHLLGASTFATGGEERLMFALFAGVNAYAAAVLLFPYRRHRTWAWLITWLEVAAFASVLPLLGGGLGLGYLALAAVAAVAQLATLRDFWPRPTPQRQDAPLRAGV